MHIVVSGKTEQFNLSKMKNNFINESSYGEDFSVWLLKEFAQRQIDGGIDELLSFGWHCVIEYQDVQYSLYINGYSEDVLNHPNQGVWRVKVERERSLFEKLLHRNLTTKEDVIVLMIADILRVAQFEEVLIFEE